MAKVPRAFVERLPDAVCYDGQMAKVEQRDCPKRLEAAFTVALPAASEFPFRPVFASVCQPNPRLGRRPSRLPDRFESEPLGRSVNSEKKPGVAAVWDEMYHA